MILFEGNRTGEPANPGFWRVLGRVELGRFCSQPNRRTLNRAPRKDKIEFLVTAEGDLFSPTPLFSGGFKVYTLCRLFLAHRSVRRAVEMAAVAQRAIPKRCKSWPRRPRRRGVGREWTPALGGAPDPADRSGASRSARFKLSERLENDKNSLVHMVATAVLLSIPGPLQIRIDRLVFPDNSVAGAAIGD